MLCSFLVRSRLLGSLKASINCFSYSYKPSGSGSAGSIVRGSLFVIVIASFLSRPKRIMVMILSSGSCIRMPASTAVKPRLMPCPSTEIFGGIYCNLRSLAFLLFEITAQIIKPKIIRAGKQQDKLLLMLSQKPPPLVLPVPPPSTITGKVITLSAGTALAGKAAPKV